MLQQFKSEWIFMANKKRADQSADGPMPGTYDWSCLEAVKGVELAIITVSASWPFRETVKTYLYC